MKKLILAGVTAILLGTAAMIPQAEARCWITPYGWHCWHPHAWWWHHHRYWHPYAYFWHPYGYWRHHPYAWRY